MAPNTRNSSQSTVGRNTGQAVNSPSESSTSVPMDVDETNVTDDIRENTSVNSSNDVRESTLNTTNNDVRESTLNTNYDVRENTLNISNDVRENTLNTSNHDTRESTSNINYLSGIRNQDATIFNQSSSVPRSTNVETFSNDNHRLLTNLNANTEFTSSINSEKRLALLIEIERLKLAVFRAAINNLAYPRESVSETIFEAVLADLEIANKKPINLFLVMKVH